MIFAFYPVSFSNAVNVSIVKLAKIFCHFIGENSSGLGIPNGHCMLAFGAFYSPDYEAVIN